MVDQSIPAKAGTVKLADGTEAGYSLEDGERVGWVWQVGYSCLHGVLSPSVEQLKAAGFAKFRRVGFMDVSGKCDRCRGAPKATAPAPKQNVPTGLPCPKPGCRGKLLLMTRKSDGRRFLACSAWYGDTRCDYTSNEIPQHLLAKEQGIPMLPGLG